MLDPSTYPPVIADLLVARVVAPLGPSVPDNAVRGRLAAIGDAAFGRVGNGEMVAACRAGLWLAFNFLDESHDISQALGTPEGSFWHAIMHRREPDAWNSKYWFRKVGPHPVIVQLVEQAPVLGYHYTDALDFVDFCERVRDSGSAEEEVAKRVQQLEWQLLFDHCYQTGAWRAEGRAE